MNTHADPLVEKATHTTAFWRRQQPASRILLVGNNDQLRRLMAAGLIYLGYQVDTAADILAGWEAVRTDHYDLLITDHNPPNLSGVELVNWLRSAQMTLPAIVLSDKLNPEEFNRDQSLQSQWLQLIQFAAVLRKPFTTDELTKTVNEALGANGKVRSPNGASVSLRDERQAARVKANNGNLPAEDKPYRPAGWQMGQPVTPGLA
jgi:CheY-like chemotaxis protein